MAMHVIIVGCGVTGLCAARELRARGLAVTIVSRSFPFGGRLRSEVVEIPGFGPAVFDPMPVVLGPAAYPTLVEGAPLGMPPVPLLPLAFRAGCAEAVVRIPVPHVGTAGEAAEYPAMRSTLRGGARALVERLSLPGMDDCVTRLAPAMVTAIEPDGCAWRVHVRADDGDKRVVRGDAILLTQPVPEAVTLLDDSGVLVPDSVRDELRGVQYEPGLALFAAFRGPSGLPQGGIVTFADSPLVALMDNHRTGASATRAALTALFDPARLECREGESDDELGRRLLPLLAAWGRGDPVWHRLRRLGCFSPANRIRMPFAEALETPPLVIAGDGFASYVENPLDVAFTSARYAVAHLCRTLARQARAAARPIQRTPRPVTVEVCVSSAEEAQTALACGATRLLLCSGPETGGLTPTVDALRMTLRAVVQWGREVPVTVLIRPRLGDFAYSDSEFRQMKRDARRMLKAGADGIAFGVLSGSQEARVEANRCGTLVELAHGFGREAVFNRAFDFLTDRAHRNAGSNHAGIRPCVHFGRGTARD